MNRDDGIYGIIMTPMRPFQIYRTLFVLCAACLLTATASARRPNPVRAPQKLDVEVQTHATDRPLANSDAFRLRFATTLDTFVLAEWDFDSAGGPSSDGWTSVDRTVNPDTFFHVASAVELDGGDFGGLVVLEGARSLWCGVQASPTDPLVCGYFSAPGYGRSWGQNFTSISFDRSGDVTLSYMIRWDSEPYYDRTTLLYTDKNGEWVNAGVGREGRDYYDADGFERESVTIPDSVLADSVQIKFRFNSDGAWCDEDGLWNTDGACIIDSLVVGDAAGTINFQDFESEQDGAHRTDDGFWQAEPDEGYGDFAGLYDGKDLLQEDRCGTNLSGMWAFINGSQYDYSCGGHPQQAVVPFPRSITNGPWTGEYSIDNEIRSPFIDWTQDINGHPIPASAYSAILEFDVYRDLPLESLVFYFWGARGVVAGCPVEWPYVGGVNLFYGEQKDWYRHRAEFAYLIGAGSDQVQVKIGVGDFCYVWCGQFGDGDCHSHAPLIDNVRVVRVDLEGPAWQVRERDLFQDNFASDGTKAGTVYIDGASEHLYAGGRADSTFVKVVACGVGVDNHVHGDPSSGPAVYCHVKDVTPAKSGDAISGDTGRWPVVSTAGGWTVLLCDYVLDPFNPPSIEDDYYCVDLNDNLFTPGDTIWYYFSARDANGNTNYYSVLGGVTGTEAEVRLWPMEVTCLPANALGGGTDILYVDDFDDRGAQPLFESAFELLGITPDRYDVLAPSAIVGNGPGSRVVNVARQISGCYQKIIWNSGDLKDGLIGDGTGSPSKSNDFGLLYAFLDQSNDSPGLYISGDNIAEEWVTLTGTDAVTLRSDYIDFNFIGGDHVALGEPVSPLVIGLPGGSGIFDHPAGPDTLVAFGGGCGIIADFDVLDAGAAAAMEMAYSGAAAHGAVLSQATPNAVGDTARVVLSGFSYHWIRDDRAATPIDRAEHLADIIRWLGNEVAPPTGAADGRTYAYSLGQNFPNPFNPSTTIGFTLAQSGHVTLKIYDVVGRLVRTLVDERRRPGTVYGSKWDGRNDSGERVASGVYFYKLVAGNFTRVRKLVLLK